MATSSNNLSNCIASCVDDARQCVSELGFNPFITTLVRIVYAGGRVGSGAATVTELELSPPPYIEQIGVEGRLRPSGLDEEGDLLCTGISLGYKETDLYSPEDVNRDSTLFLYRIDGADAAHGLRSRYYTPSAPPIPNTGGKKGQMLGQSWSIRLRRTVDPQL